MRYFLSLVPFSIGLLIMSTSFSHAEISTDNRLTEVDSLSELLLRIQHFEKSESENFEARIARFSLEKTQQKKLLLKADRALKRAQKKSAQLSGRFEKNEKAIANLKVRLKTKSGDLGELFGVVKQVSGDVRSKFQQSYITPQYPERLKVIDTLARGKVLPDAKQLANFWFELQREMMASGQVVQYTAPVIDLTGEETQKKITRVGNFNAFLAGKYLVSQISQPGFVEIQRQPQGLHTRLLLDFDDHPNQLNPLSIDPSRGSILSLLTKAPSFQERIQQGGYVGYVILGIGVIGLLFAVERLVYLAVVSRRMKIQLHSDKVNLNNPLGRVLGVFQTNRTSSVEALELKLDEEILRNMPPLERGITTIKVLAAVAPLLGLLGTVIGMIQTFQAITLFGTGDPKLMAGGICEALVTTMLGLIVAVPLILSHSMVSTRSRRLMKVMEEQSTGYIARHAQSLERRD